MYTRKKSPPGGRPSREKVYDRKFKTFVMHKEVFAFAAARLVRQFKGVPYQELVGLVQRNDRERDTARLDTLAGFSTDGRLRAQMNIEGQNLSSSYRKIRTRMLRYPCRLVADQKERQVPTVSLWLCFGFPRKYRGKEKTYTLRKLGDDLFWCDTLDEMLKVAVVCVPALEDVQLGVGLGGFFAVLLSSGLSTRQKVEKLQAWGFVMTEEMQKENEEMLDTWEGFGAALTKEGVRKGKREGRSIGMREATISHVRNLATKQKLSFDEAMEILGVSKESRDDIRGELTQDQKKHPGEENIFLKKDDMDMYIGVGIGPWLFMRGVQIGIKKGRLVGKQDVSALHVRNLAEKQHISFEEAMEILKIPKASRTAIHKKIAQYQKRHDTDVSLL